MKKLLMQDESLFKNMEIFDIDHVPEEFLYRDQQVASLNMCIKPALRGTKPLNALLIGKTATGKTTSVKMLFKELKEHSNKVLPVYINCQIYSTQYKIFSEIYRIVLGYAPPTSGLPLSELFDKIFSNLAKKKRLLLVALDDCDFIFDRNNTTIYEILRCHEVFDGVKAGIWCIGQKNNMHLLDDKSRSVFNPSVIEYNPYTNKEKTSILSGRISAGLYPGVFSKELVETIAEHCFDLRQAIECIKKAVLLAESEASRAVKQKHVMKFLDIGNKSKVSKPETNKFNILSTDYETKQDAIDKIILDVLKQSELESNELFKQVRKHAKNYSKFYRTLQAMEKNEKIEIKKLRKGQGWSSLVCLKKA